MAIPKVIHYCWFGGNPKSKLIEKCIRSWKKYCPDYEIIEWNESNFDINLNAYCRQAYEAKKWAFVSDYARLHLLYHHGGIYFDTDVELIRKIDDLLEHSCFMGIEKSDRCIKVNTGLILGAEKEYPLIKIFLNDYEHKAFIKSNGAYDLTTCTVLSTQILKRYGYVEEDKPQEVMGAVIYPTEYFSPINMESGIMQKTKHTYSIHHYALSWTTPGKQKVRKKAVRKMKRMNRIHKIKTIPNRVLMVLLGIEKYEKLKQLFGRK